MELSERLKCKGILAIDFDGTIADTQFPTINGLRRNAKEVINKLKDEGFYIIVWTCRVGQSLLEAEQFLKEEGIKFDQINNHHPFLIEAYKNDTRKISADVYIDDKCMFDLPPWAHIYHLVHQKMAQQTCQLHYEF